jgi:transposase
LGPINKPVYAFGSGKIDYSLSLTILTSLVNPEQPVLVDIRENTNTQWDFLSFIMNAVRLGHLVSGDYLVLDNASIHSGSESWPLLTAFLDAAEIEICFLPCYSPELNPCEFVFSYVKSKLRFQRDITQHLIFDIIHAIATISPEHLLGCYLHCFSANS